MRLYALLSVLALVLVVAGCGDDDDGSSSGSQADRSSNGGTSLNGSNSGGAGSKPAGDATAPESDDRTTSRPNGATDGNGDNRTERRSERADAARARAVLVQLYAAMRRSDVGRVCELLTPTARRQVATSVNVDKGATCEKSFGRYYAFAEKDGSLAPTVRARVLKARVNGNRAVVVVRFPGQAPRGVELVRAKKGWRLPASSPAL